MTRPLVARFGGTSVTLTTPELIARWCKVVAPAMAQTMRTRREDEDQ